MSSVICPQFCEYISDLAFNRFFRDRELRSDLFVRIPLGNQLPDADFRWRERIVGRVLGTLKSNL